MGQKARSVDIIRTATIGGRTFTVIRTTWWGTSGLSFDVHDVATGLCLTGESFDNEPTDADITDLVTALRDDLTNGCLSMFHRFDVDKVRTVVGQD